jgi:hypothetical protein
MEMNYLAFAAAVVAQMVIGFVWFHPKVMGEFWAKANGKTLEELMPAPSPMMMITTIIYTLLFTMFLTFNVTGAGQEAIEFHTAKHGLFHAVVMTIMVMLPVFGTPGLYEKRGWNWILCHIGYWFLRMAVAMAILSAWR